MRIERPILKWFWFTKYEFCGCFVIAQLNESYCVYVLDEFDRLYKMSIE